MIPDGMAANPSSSPTGEAKANTGYKPDAHQSSVDTVKMVVEDIADAAEAAKDEGEVEAVVVAFNNTPGLNECLIAPDVLTKLLPDEDIVMLPRLDRIGGGVIYRFVKRAFDIISSSCALLVLAIPFAVIAIMIKRQDPGPVIYAQTRIGMGGKLFKVYKFRSMYMDAETRGAQWAQGDDPRVTPLGRKLRSSRLDETPQFVNVIKGDIPLRILKTRPEFSEKSMGAFALPAKSSTNKGKAFSQVASCLASGLRMRRISEFNCKRFSSTEGQFLAIPVFKAVCA